MSQSNLDDKMSYMCDEDDIREDQRVNDLPLNKTQADKIEFYNSETFKMLEDERRERSKPSKHTPVDFNRVWCPVYSKVRPEWLCSQEHGDYHEYLEEEE